MRYRRHDGDVFLYASDLIELNGDDFRRAPLEGRKATLEMMLAKAGPGIRSLPSGATKSLDFRHAMHCRRSMASASSSLLAGVYSGKILNGARPAELPVVQSAKFRAADQPKDCQVARTHFPACIACHLGRVDRINYLQSIHIMGS